MFVLFSTALGIIVEGCRYDLVPHNTCILHIHAHNLIIEQFYGILGEKSDPKI